MVAANLAVGLAQNGAEHAVALLDMNLLFGEVPLFLDIRPKYHWAAVAESITRVDRSYLLNALTRHSSGLYVLSSPSKLNGHGRIAPEAVGRLLLKLRETFDFVVIDTGQRIDELSARTLEISDTILLVSILSLPCLDQHPQDAAGL